MPSTVIHPAFTPDVFISGAGPAGLACAISLAQKGLQVHVADGMKPPIDKACGEGLMPDTLAALSELGITLEDAANGEPEQHARIRGIRFVDAKQGNAAQAPFPSGPGRGMKRKLLHQLLLDRANALGVHFGWETTVRSISNAEQKHSVPHSSQHDRDEWARHKIRRKPFAPTWNTVETTHGIFHPRFIIGADGHQSRIRSWAGLDRASITARRIGLRQHFAISPWTDFVEVHWSSHGQAYVTPVSSSEVCVAFVAHRKFLSVAEAMAHFPELQGRLAAAPPSDTPRGAITFSRKLHRVTRGNVALLGDASGSVDAVTGEGMSLCFRQALALAEAIASNNLAAYQQAHTAMRRLPHLMASTMLLMDRSPFLRSRTIAAFERRPQLFARLLEIHIGHSPLLRKKWMHHKRCSLKGI